MKGVKKTGNKQSQSLQGELTSLARPVRVVYVSSYIPRKCGIATFTKDLTNAINLLNPLALAEIAAMDNTLTKDSITYPHEVRFRIFDQKKADYLRVAAAINKDPTIDLVCLQHEFGIYGGPEGRLILELLTRLHKPIIVTLHTVSEHPSKSCREVLIAVCKKARAVVVMLTSSAHTLTKHYGVSKGKIAVIHHGVPDFPRLDIAKWKRQLSFTDRTIAASINLMSDYKGNEYVIRAIPDIIRVVPNFLY